MDLDRVLHWHAELEARAAARAHFWIEEQDAPASHQVQAGLAQVHQSHLSSSPQSQIPLAFEPIRPEPLEEYPLDTENSTTQWQVFGYVVAYLLHPASVRGCLRPLRPPGTEEASIRAPPQCLEGHADTNPAEKQHENSSSRVSTLPTTGATITERNHFHTLRIYLTLRVLNHELPVAGTRAEGKPVLQRTNSCSSVFLDPQGDTSTEAYSISRWHFPTECKQQLQPHRNKGRLHALERVLNQPRKQRK
jgi:hypothetical protein